MGAVAGLNLDWFESRPLFGRRVVVTRSRRSGPGPVRRPVRRRRRARGGARHRASSTRPTAGPRCAPAVAELSSYDWVVVSSANGAADCWRALRDARDLAGVQVAAVGLGHRRGPGRGRHRGRPGARPLRGRGAGRGVPACAGASASASRAGCCWCGPRWPATWCPTAWRAKGWTVEVVRRLPHGGRGRVRRRPTGGGRRRRGHLHLVVHRRAVRGRLRPRRACPRVVASIGPVTSATARRLGLARGGRGRRAHHRRVWSTALVDHLASSAWRSGSRSARP